VKYILMFLQIIPAIVSAIKSIEEFLPVSGIGKEKLALIREGLTRIYGDLSGIWPAIETFVAGLVKLANDVGVFKKDLPKKIEDEPVVTP